MTILPKSPSGHGKNDKGSSCSNSLSKKKTTLSKPGTSKFISSKTHSKLVLLKPSSSKLTHQTQQKERSEKNLECNSDDEYGAGFRDDELELRFAERLKKSRGLIIKEVKGDGACMFRAVADQVYGDEEMHVDVRQLCMDYIAKNRDHFSQFLTEDFDEYLQRKRESDAHGNHVELQAISEIFLRPIEIYEYSIDPINVFHPISPEANTGGVENPPLRLSYHGTVHYNSVIDPFTATIGVGLGLPEFKPGLADKNLMKEATLASEAQHIEEAMLNDKLKMTDWERTEEELSKQIAKESYMEYLRQVEQDFTNQCDNKQKAHINITQNSSTNLIGLEKEQLKVEKILHVKNQNVLSATSGSKRGASSPNIPCSSHNNFNCYKPTSCNQNLEVENFNDSRSASPLPKIYRNERSCSSMPNIGLNFNSSFFYSKSDLMMPSTSGISEPFINNEKKKTNEVNERKKSINKTIASLPTTNLYEELLAANALASEEWNSTDAYLDESAEIARVLALSKQEFFESMKRQNR